MSAAAAAQQKVPAIGETYQSASTLAGALVHYRLELLNSKEMCTALPKGLRGRLLKDYEAIQAMRLLIRHAEELEKGDNVRLALYQFVSRHRELESVLRKGASSEALKQPIRFRPLRPKLVADKDPVIDLTYDDGADGLIAGLHDYLLEVLGSPGLTELINEDLHATLCGMRDRWEAFSDLVREASMPARRDLRVALLQFARQCGQPLAWMLTDDSYDVLISENNERDIEKEMANLNSLAVPLENPIEIDDLSRRRNNLGVPSVFGPPNQAMQHPAQTDAKPSRGPLPAIEEADPLKGSTGSATSHAALAEECRRQAFHAAEGYARNALDETNGRSRVIVNETSILYPRPDVGWLRFTVQLQAGPQELKSAELSLRFREAQENSADSVWLRLFRSVSPTKDTFRVLSIFPAPDQRWQTGVEGKATGGREATVSANVGYDYATFTGSYTRTSNWEISSTSYMTTGGVATSEVTIKANPGAGGVPNPIAPAFPFDILFERPRGPFEIKVKLRFDGGGFLRRSRRAQVLDYDGQTERGRPPDNGFKHQYRDRTLSNPVFQALETR